ncbi:Sec-independent protein translocase subunit TatA [Brachybacterium nesterenkovii]|uniref:Sec-independent protein translocase protein TatA n=1 Tax=Brachybacterium nesterenkovii TaxID=47847 RepID=A0A1X6WUT1_9MICO|nr:Sec-independent protein translocase subunit TatA [Brachybacterium nesterenkovii]SLM89020.1 Twin-arginine translocation protein TatA [Brachybacterium nesterenkovii]
MGALKPWHIVVLVVLVLLLFGAGKLPSLARNLGKSMRIFKSEVEELRGDPKPEEDEVEDDRPRRSDRDRDGRRASERESVSRDREYDARDLDREADRVHVRDEEAYRRD